MLSVFCFVLVKSVNFTQLRVFVVVVVLLRYWCVFGGFVVVGAKKAVSGWRVVWVGVKGLLAGWLLARFCGGFL